MGALHAGHMALVAEARQRGARVVASIFVNPTQFGPEEDLARYPRREAEDAAMLEGEGCDLLWAPDAGTMYPAGHSTSVRVAGLTAWMEGASRPGHFDGVATIVTKLLNQVRPDLALFGEKDFQQLAVIRTLVRDLDMDVEIIGVPTQRDADGLALSSRNIFLSADQRIAARALPRALLEGAQRLRGGADVANVLASAGAALEEAGFSTPDYVQLCDPDTLQPLDRLDRPARLLIAARLGTTRLLDNVAVEKH
jgi:pantoate--beta-alanine ligase